jgi:hypothetical protein
MRTLAFALVLGCLAAARPGLAAGYPDEYALRPLQLPAGMAQLKVPVIINLSRGQVGSPVWIPFELRLGLTDELELRLFHPVRGLCVSGRSHGCGRVYNDLGLSMLYSVMGENGMDLALLLGFEVASFADPALLRLDAGMAFKYVHAPFSIATWPTFGVGLNHRDRNGDAVNLPVELAFQLSFPTALFLESGLYGSPHNLSNDWSMPLGVGINYLLAHGVDLGAELKLTGVGNGGLDGRLLIVYFAVRN